MLFLGTDTYSELVPTDGPPSFRGQAVKYVYKLTIGCQRVNSPIKLLRVPFRVLVLHGMFHSHKYCSRDHQEHHQLFLFSLYSIFCSRECYPPNKKRVSGTCQKICFEEYSKSISLLHHIQNLSIYSTSSAEQTTHNIIYVINELRIAKITCGLIFICKWYSILWVISIILCNCVILCVFRHAWAPFPTGWGSVTHKPLPGRGGGRKKRHKTSGASARHADDHYLTPLSTSVKYLSMLLIYSCFYAHFISARHLHWHSSPLQICLISLTCEGRWPNSVSLRLCTD